MNGNDKSENELRCLVTENSAHHTFWADATNVLYNMRYVDKVTREIITSVPSLKNWLFTINGFQKVWKTLHEQHGFQNFKPRYCNQDIIENFFGQIRSHAVRHTNPIPQQFVHSFITLLVSNMSCVSITGGNCEITNDNSMLLSLEECLQNVSSDEVHGVDRNNICDDEPHDMFTDKVVTVDSIVAFNSEYLDDIISRILKQLNNCQECENSLKCSEFPVYARQIICFFTKLLKTRSHRRNVLQVLLQHFDNWNKDINWSECLEHQNVIFDIVVRAIGRKVMIYWCERKNTLIRYENENSLCTEVNYMEDIVNLKRMREMYRKQRCERKRVLRDYRESVTKKVKV